MIVSKIAGDWIRTADVWYRKRPLYHLRHNHCPNGIIGWLKSWNVKNGFWGMVAGAAVVKQVTFFFRFLTEGDGRSGGEEDECECGERGRELGLVGNKLVWKWEDGSVVVDGGGGAGYGWGQWTAKEFWNTLTHIHDFKKHVAAATATAAMAAVAAFSYDDAWILLVHSHSWQMPFRSHDRHSANTRGLLTTQTSVLPLSLCLFHTCFAHTNVRPRIPLAEGCRVPYWPTR